MWGIICWRGIFACCNASAPSLRRACCAVVPRRIYSGRLTDMYVSSLLCWTLSMYSPFWPLMMWRYLIIVVRYHLLDRIKLHWSHEWHVPMSRTPFWWYCHCAACWMTKYYQSLESIISEAISLCLRVHHCRIRLLIDIIPLAVYCDITHLHIANPVHESCYSYYMPSTCPNVTCQLDYIEQARCVSETSGAC